MVFSSGAAAAAAMIARAIKASGVLVTLLPEEFARLLAQVPEPLVVYSEGGWLSTKYSYLVSHRGLAFYTRSKYPLELPQDAEIVMAKGIWIP